MTICTCNSPSTCGKVHQGPGNAEMHEHDKAKSRITGRYVEISMGPHGDGQVPANPFASLAQAGYMHTHPDILGKEGLKEWDQATKGKKLPKHVK